MFISCNKSLQMAAARRWYRVPAMPSVPWARSVCLLCVPGCVGLCPHFLPLHHSKMAVPYQASHLGFQVGKRCKEERRRKGRHLLKSRNVSRKAQRLLLTFHWLEVSRGSLRPLTESVKARILMRYMFSLPCNLGFCDYGRRREGI